MTLGILISVIFFTLLAGCFNMFLNNPLKQLQALKAQDKKKRSTINDLRDRSTNLEESVRAKDERIREREVEILEIIRNNDTASLNHLRAMAQQEDAIMERSNTIRQRDERISELTRFQNEADELRPRVGQQQDRIRELQQSLQRTEEELDAERQKNAENARRLAFVTAEMAKRSLGTEPL